MKGVVLGAGPLLVAPTATSRNTGAGKVWTFGHGNTVNAFAEPQYSVIHSGVGVPIWQVFAGINLQFAIGGG